MQFTLLYLHSGDVFVFIEDITLSSVTFTKLLIIEILTNKIPADQ